MDLNPDSKYHLQATLFPSSLWNIDDCPLRTISPLLFSVPLITRLCPETSSRLAKNPVWLMIICWTTLVVLHLPILYRHSRSSSPISNPHWSHCRLLLLVDSALFWRGASAVNRIGLPRETFEWIVSSDGEDWHMISTMSWRLCWDTLKL